MSVTRGIVHNTSSAVSELQIDQIIAFEKTYRTIDNKVRVVVAIARLLQNSPPVPKFVALVANPGGDSFFAIPVSSFIEETGPTDKSSPAYADAVRVAKSSGIYPLLKMLLVLRSNSHHLFKLRNPQSVNHYLQRIGIRILFRRRRR